MSTTEHTPEESNAPESAAPAPESEATDAPAVAEAPAEPEVAAEAPAEAETEAPAEAEAPAEVAAEAPAEAAATPKPAPMPSPSAIRPRPLAPVSPAPDAEPSADSAKFGRVADDGTVEVLEGEAWRTVGQYPDGTPDEALKYFRRKYDDLEFKVNNLEQRHAAGGAAASDLTSQAKHLLTEVVGAAAVGDLVGLAGRLEGLVASLAEAAAEEAAAARAAVDAAIEERTQIVVRAEALAAKDPKSLQWKQASAELAGLFDDWQRHQTDGPRLPRGASQDLWKRFRTARTSVEKSRREFFSQLDEAHKGARNEKTKLVERAEALAGRGEDGIPAYRALLDEWKRAGRAGRKVDDALWARFKAAGDTLYQARSERDEAEQAESAPRIEARKELLVEAKAVADEKDLRKARQLLTGIQRRWDEVGRIFPRDKERALDDDMRKIEQALRAREDVDWKQNNPETQARADGMSRQLLEAIAGLEADLAAAEAKGDKKKIAEAQAALEARRSWLQALGGGK